MEINTDAYRYWFNCNILWGENSPKIEAGDQSPKTVQENPLCFYNAYVPDSANYPTHNTGNNKKVLNNNFVWVNHAEDSFWIHGARLNCQKLVFPRGIAHPYVQNSPFLNAEITVAYPEITYLKSQIGGKSYNVAYLTTGPRSLSHFSDGCFRQNHYMNLYLFSPVWNSQFRNAGGDPHQTLRNSWDWWWPNEFINMPLDFDLRFTDGTDSNGDHMRIGWLRDISYMFANRGMGYPYDIEIPPFITNLDGMFYNFRMDQFGCNIRLNSEIFYLNKAGRPDPCWNGPSYDKTPIFVTTNNMFSGTSWPIDTNNIQVLMNGTGHLSSKVISAVNMFSGSRFSRFVQGGNFYVDSRLLYNASGMLRSTVGVNDKRIVFDDNNRHPLLNDYIDHNFDFTKSFVQVHDASYMFCDSDLNAEVIFPNNGIHNAFYMFGITYGTKDKSNFYCRPAGDLYSKYKVYIPDYYGLWNASSVSHELYSTDDTALMFSNVNLSGGTNSNIYVGWGVGNVNAHAMFYNTSISANINFGSNSIRNNYHHIFGGYRSSLVIDHIVIGNDSFSDPVQNRYNTVFDFAGTGLEFNVNTVLMDNNSFKCISSFIAAGRADLTTVKINNLIFHSNTVNVGGHNFFGGRGFHATINNFIGRVSLGIDPGEPMPLVGNLEKMFHYQPNLDIVNMNVYTRPGAGSKRPSTEEMFFGCNNMVCEEMCLFPYANVMDKMFLDCTRLYGGNTMLNNFSGFYSATNMFKNCRNMSDNMVFVAEDDTIAIERANNMFNNAAEATISTSGDELILRGSDFKDMFHNATMHLPSNINIVPTRSDKVLWMDSMFYGYNGSHIDRVTISGQAVYAYAFKNSGITNIYTESASISGVPETFEPNSIVRCINQYIASEVRRMIMGSSRAHWNVNQGSGNWYYPNGEFREHGIYYDGPVYPNSEGGAPWNTPDGTGRIEFDNLSWAGSYDGSPEPNTIQIYGNY